MAEKKNPAKKNCWEAMNCGREEGGANAAEQGVCAAYTHTELDGANSGKNGGRICWYIAGTMCKGQRQGTFSEKRATCLACPVFETVRTQEGENFRMTKTA